MPRDSLATYRAKRDFQQTAEPSGKTAVAASEQLRFVIQRHDATRLHYDFRLELDGVFLSWAVTKGPSLDPTVKRLAVQTEDHPLDYGDFEGTIPKGQYGGGTVQLWDRGYWIPEGDPHEGLKKGDLKFTLVGNRLEGSWVLVRMKWGRDSSRQGGDSKRTNWLLIKHRDPYAHEGADAVHDRKEAHRRRGLAEQQEGWRQDRCRAGEQGDGEEGPRHSLVPLTAARQVGRETGVRSGLGARGQVRRLPTATAGGRRQGHAQDAQRPRLDGQVPGDRRCRRAAARLHDRRRGLRARQGGRAEFLRPAG